MKNEIESMLANIHGIPKFPFESFLQDKHAEEYHGLDDEMSDAYDAWVAELNGEQLIAYGNEALLQALTLLKK